MRNRTEEQISKWIEKYYLDPLGLVAKLEGYYECPKDNNGKRLGPLVGYSGRYGKKKLQYVGEVYVNFAVVEEEPAVLSHFANLISDKIIESMRIGRSIITTYCGYPDGGIALAYQMARVNSCRFIYPEEITSLPSDNALKESELVFRRHQITENESVAICQDVLNDFSTIEKTIDLIESFGAEVVAIIGLLNSSVKFGNRFDYQDKSIPVFSLVQKEILQWEQEDPFVVDDIIAGNIIWDSRKDWYKLKKFMTLSKK